jgi:hypothetical protein
VHVVGIDQAVNAGFLARLAAIGRGRCELVESEDRLDEAAAQIHKRIMSPVVTGLALHSDELRLLPAGSSSRPPDLFAGAPVTVFGRFDGACPPQATMTVRGVSADGSRYEQMVTGAPVGRAVGSASTPPVTAAWARGYLRELEDQYASKHPASAADLDRLEQQMVTVSLSFGVLCRFTAFVAVDARVVTDGQRPHRVTQPVELPSGWHAASRIVPLAAAAAMPAAMPAAVPAAMLSRTPAVTSGGHMLRSAPIPRGLLSQLADELSWLDTQAQAPAAELARDLADLGSRLTALISWFSGSRVNPGLLASLIDLIAKLRACDNGSPPLAGPPLAGPPLAGPPPAGPQLDALVALRDEARRVLRDFLAQTGPAGPADPYQQGDPQAGRTFWRRPRPGP